MSLHLTKTLLTMVRPVLTHTTFENGALETTLILGEFSIRLGKDVHGRSARATLRGEGRRDGIMMMVHGVSGGEHGVVVLQTQRRKKERKEEKKKKQEKDLAQRN